jgi:hypothetical protein
MATIDIRATVTCSLGTLISGSVSDDYIQGSGLVKTRGSCELKGILTPAVGTVVTFSYARNGTTKKVPRKLRVLSSFADPFRQITKVELGCKLTYMDNVTPAPTVDGQAAETSGRQQQCLNGYIDYPANSPVPIPVSAAGVMNTCLTKLGLTASSNPLTNRFNIDTFDLSAGYVSVLGDLLQSEGYFGYLDQNEKLQVCDLTKESGKGLVITAADVVDIGAIGVGELPGDAVVVRYNAIKLNSDLDAADQYELEQRNWELEETTGPPQQVEVRYTDSEGNSLVSSHSYVPHSSTKTTYGEDSSWDDTVCVIASSAAEGADLSSSVIQRTTSQRTIKAESANGYCAQVLSAGLDPVGSTEGTVTRIEDYEYDANGQLVRQISRIYEPFFKWAGGIGVDFVYYTDGSAACVTLGSTPVLVEEVIQEFETIYAPKPRLIQLKAGETYERSVDSQKTTTTTYRNWVLTLGGQQGSASIKEWAPFTAADQLASWLANTSRIMVMVDSQVRTQRGRGGTAGQVRAPQALRIGQANGSSAETTAQLAYAMGGATSDRFVSFSMPYQSDDIFTSSGTIQRGDAQAKALRYGRIQNRLLLGNRNGVNLQLHPSKLPARPFDPFYLSNGSLMVQYRANGLNWAFSSEGIVTSVDALFWGVAGGSGTSWVPVAPGITTFPALPAVQDTTPTEVIGTVASVGSTPQTQLDAAFPSAVSGDGVQDLSTEDYWVYDGSSWGNEGPNPGPSASVAAVVPPWNELVPFDGVTRTTAVVVDYAYALGSVGTEAVVLVTRTTFTVGSVVAAEAGAFNVSGQASTGRYVRGIAGGAGSFALTGRSAGNVRSYAIGTNAGTFTLAGQNATVAYQRQPMQASIGSIVLSGQDAQFLSAITLAAAAASLAVTGQNAGSVRSYSLGGSAASFTATGQNANLGVADPSFSSVSLLLHMDGSNGSTSFVDSSANALTVTAVGNAQISTAQSKFGGSSALFDGTGDYLSIPDNSGFNFGSGAFTIEAWVYYVATTGSFAIASQRASTTSNASWSLSLISTNNGPTFSYSTSGTSLTTLAKTFSFSGNANGWHHFAVCRSANTLYFFADGTSLGTSALVSTPFYDSTAPVFVGATNSASPTSFMNGYIEELRITKGVARYTANFTVPSQAFPSF